MSVPTDDMPSKEHQPGHSHGEPFNPSSLPPEPADFLKDRPFACLLHGTDNGTVFIVKMPAHEINSVRGRVPIHLRHELYEHPTAPVIRTVLTIHDQPDRPLAIETFTNIEDEQQRSDFASLATQRDFLILFYDEALRHRLIKRVDYSPDEVTQQILPRAEEVLARIPKEKFDFEKAKRAVMERTTL